MSAEGERLSRAGNYVLGLMSDADRARAERDLEVDPAFRDAVLSIAERMHALDFAPQKDIDPAERWRQIAERIGELPQMRRARSADDAATAAGAKVKLVALQAADVPLIRNRVVVAALLLAVLVGYAAGVMTGWLW